MRLSSLGSLLRLSTQLLHTCRSSELMGSSLWNACQPPSIHLIGSLSFSGSSSSQYKEHIGLNNIGDNPGATHSVSDCALQVCPTRAGATLRLCQVQSPMARKGSQGGPASFLVQVALMDENVLTSLIFALAYAGEACGEGHRLWVRQDGGSRAQRPEITVGWQAQSRL